VAVFCKSTHAFIDYIEKTDIVSGLSDRLCNT